MEESGAVVAVRTIERRILLIRGQRVMLDRDLALLYGVETRTLNQAVRRNIQRFPGDFMFLLTREEILRISQSVTSYSSLRFSKRVAAFTQEGVAMLSGVLSGSRAVQVNISIMRAFVKLRQILAAHKGLAGRLAALERRMTTHDIAISGVIEAIKQLAALPLSAAGVEEEESPAEPEKPKIGFRVTEPAELYRRANRQRRSLATLARRRRGREGRQERSERT